MKFEPKDKIPEKKWYPCPDHIPYTTKEKILHLINDPIQIIPFIIVTLLRSREATEPFFGNCKHLHECKNVRHEPFGDCEAGEWKL